MRTLLLITFLSSLFSCQKNNYSNDQFYGNWISKNKTTVLTLNPDLTFKVDNFPDSCVLWESTDHKTFGSGKWSLIDGQLGKEIRLKFNQETVGNLRGFSFSFLIESDHNLYMWVRDEGGPKYELIKAHE